MKPVKLGIIGCGIAANKLHWPALKGMKNKFEIVCVCNHTKPKAKDFARTVGGVPYVLDYHELLKMEDVEAVDIALPIELNYSVTKDALDSGKHVIVEKPLACNLSEGRKMSGFPNKYKQVMMVAENFRYFPTILKIKECIEEGKIGEPYWVFWNNFNCISTDNMYAQTKWRIKHKYPGGFITDGGVHNMAALRFLFGDITSGRALAKSINPKIGKMDSMSMQFCTTSNVNGVFNCFFSANGNLENRLTILGKKGSIVLERDTILINRDQQTFREAVAANNGCKGEFENFYYAIREGQNIVSNFYEAYKDLEVIITAVKSAEKGQAFYL
jgi:predicted dehydrogenase